MRRVTDRHTHRHMHGQSAVANIHLAWLRIMRNVGLIIARDGLTQQPTPLTPTGQTASVSLSRSAPLSQPFSDSGQLKQRATHSQHGRETRVLASMNDRRQIDRFIRSQWCIADFAPGTPCVMDSPVHDTRRCLQGRRMQPITKQRGRQPAVNVAAASP